MKKVDVIFPNYINAAIGPTGTLRRLLKNKEYLKSRGYELEVFSYDFLISDGTQKEVDFSKGLGIRSKIKQLLRKNKLTSILFVLRYIHNANRLVKKYLTLNRHPDIVVFHEADACTAYIKHSNLNVLKVCFFHTDGKRWEMFLQSYPKLRNTYFMRYMNKRMEDMLQALDAYAFITNIGKQNFLQENPSIDINKVFCFHNGINELPLLNIEKDHSKFAYRLCCTGTLCHRKGQYIIIDAMHMLNDNIRSKIHLSLFGPGPDYIILKEKVKEYNLEDQVTFYGSVSNNDIHEKLSQEDIFILMSNNEGLPISIIEAMRAGLPVISTTVSGIPEQVRPLYNGILIEPSVKELVNVLNDLPKYDWEGMGKNSRIRFENEFTFTQMMNSYCDMLDKIILHK